MEPGGRSGAGLLAVAGAVASFSISSALVKWADTPGSVIAFWRMVGAVLAWWLVLVVLRGVRARPLPTASTWRAVTPAGLFFGANISLFFTAVTKTSIAHAEFITSLSPLLLVPAGAIVFGERPQWKALGWGLISLVGIAIVLAFGPPSGTATVGGDLLMLVVLCTWVGYLVTARTARATVGVVDFMSTVMPVGLITATPIALLIAGDELWPLTAKAWASSALLTVLTGMIAHGLIAIAQREVDVGVIGILQVSQPALAVGWAYLLIDEEIRLAQVPGMVLVLVGLLAFTLATRRRLPAAVDDAPAMLVDHAG